jgi:protein TonB
VTHVDILDQRDSLRAPFTGAVALHVAVVGGLAVYMFLLGHREAFGDPNAGGAAVGITVTKAIPLPHTGPENPVAHDTQSQVPQQPAKQERAKKEPPPPKDAIALKSKTAKQPRAKVETQPQRHFKPFEEVDPSKIKSQHAQEVSNKLFSDLPGAGRIGAGANTTLGSRFGAYSALIQERVTQHWRTGDVDASIRTAPQVVVKFEIQRDGTVSSPSIVQGSGISTLDFSVRRAILEASPFPPLPREFERSSATVEFVFELKR